MANRKEQALKLLLVNDHAVVRAGYRRLLENSLLIISVVDAGSGERGYACYAAQTFDLVITDLSLPGIGGLEAIRRITQRDRCARVRVFSIHDESAFIERALEAGACGYISKSSAADVLVEAVDKVLCGEIYLGLDIAKCLTGPRRAEQRPLFAVLSPREFDIFRLLAEAALFPKSRCCYR